MRPIGWVGDEAVFDRVEMDVIDMPSIIGVVADGVFPIATLPQDAAGIVLHRQLRAGLEKPLGEHRLDAPPAVRKISVAALERQDGVQVLRQHDDGVDIKGPLRHCGAKGFPKGSDVRGQPGCPPVGKRDGDEEGAAWNKVAAIADQHDLNTGESRHHHATAHSLSPVRKST